MTTQGTTNPGASGNITSGKFAMTAKNDKGTINVMDLLRKLDVEENAPVSV